MRAKLDNVLSDKHKFLKSARCSFKQFNVENSGYLIYDEIRSLMSRLIYNLCLPPIGDKYLWDLVNQFSDAKDGSLNEAQFCLMFWQVLWHVKKKYYPAHTISVIRSHFVGVKAIGEGQINRYLKFEKKLGQGSFGEVHIVVERFSRIHRCVKVIDKENAVLPINQIESEVNVLKTLDHPNIIKILDVYEEAKYLYIVQDLCVGGELSQRVKMATEKGKILTEKYVKEIIEQILRALSYMHARNIVHKDLKPDNILFSDSNVHSEIKLIDFGLSEKFKSSNSISHNVAGTILYMAPEVFSKCISVKCDMWSLGCVMYYLLTSKPPFTGRSHSEIRYNILNSEPNLSYLRYLSSDAVHMLSCLLSKNPNKRPTAQNALRHPWFASSYSRSNNVIPHNIVRNLIRSSKHTKLKLALINLVAHQQSFSTEKTREISDVYKKLDVKATGTISRDVFIKELIRCKLTAWEANRIVQAIDIDDSQDVSYTEFLAAAYNWTDTELNLLRGTFQKLDIERNGTVCLETLVALLCGSSDANIETLYQEISKLANEDNSGEINWDRFLKFMTQHTKEGPQESDAGK